MATASAFGFSGYDPWGSFLEGSMNQHFGKKSLDYQLKKQYEYYKKNLLETPSLQRQGLEAAGYNPLLAINGGIGHASFGPSASMSFPSSSASGGFDASDFASSVERIKALSGKDPKKVAGEQVKQVGLQTKQAEATVEKTQAEVDKVRQEIDNLRQEKLESEKRTWLENPIFGPIAGALGYKAAEKLGGLFGGSAKQVGQAPIVKMWNKAAASAARKAALKSIGSRALGSLGFGLPLLIGTAAWDAHKRGYKEGEKKTFRVAPWPNAFAPTH